MVVGCGVLGECLVGSVRRIVEELTKLELRTESKNVDWRTVSENVVRRIELENLGRRILPKNEDRWTWAQNVVED